MKQDHNITEKTKEVQTFSITKKHAVRVRFLLILFKSPFQSCMYLRILDAFLVWTLENIIQSEWTKSLL